MRIGFIGAGNMARAILRGALDGGMFTPADAMVYDIDQAKLNALVRDTGVGAAADNADLCRRCDIIVLAVKPAFCHLAINEIFDEIPGKAMISIAAGWTVKMLTEQLPEGVRLLRVMPNTPAMVGEGATALCSEHTLTDAEFGFAKGMFDSLGVTVTVPERLINAAVGVSGSGPAYAYMFMEALADGGVACGLPRDMAQKLAAQTLIGAARMVLETGEHPGALKDAVCSPGGTTIQAVRALENGGMRATVMEAVIASFDKACEIERK